MNSQLQKLKSHGVPFPSSGSTISFFIYRTAQLGNIHISSARIVLFGCICPAGQRSAVVHTFDFLDIQRSNVAIYDAVAHALLKF